MRNSFLVLFILFLTPAILLAEDDIPNKAMCSVCVLQGETEPEKVKAHSEHDGQAYYFCSKNCKKEFDSDPEAYLPPEFPRPAPEIIAETLNGSDVSLGDFKDKVVFLDFWATWCQPCLKIMPELQEFHTRFSSQGLVVVGISIDEDKDAIKKIKKFTQKLEISYPILFDAKQTPAWHQFKVKAIPAAFLIDRNGQIVAQWTGKIDHTEIENAIIAQLEK